MTSRTTNGPARVRSGFFASRNGCTEGERTPRMPLMDVTARGAFYKTRENNRNNLSYAGSVQSQLLTDCRSYAILTVRHLRGYSFLTLKQAETHCYSLGIRKHVSSDDSLELNVFSGKGELQILQYYKLDLVEEAINMIRYKRTGAARAVTQLEPDAPHVGGQTSWKQGAYNKV